MWRGDVVDAVLHEERFVGVTINVRHSTIGDEVSQISLTLYELSVFVKCGLAVRVLVRVIVNAPIVETKELVKSMAIWPRFRLEAKMPFAKQRGGIAPVSEQLGDRRFSRG